MDIIRAFASLDCARYVRVDIQHQLILVWKGGHTINAYDQDFQAVTAWSVGDFADDSATLQEVAQSMTKHIKTGDYP